MEDWERILRVHSLVLKPQEHVNALVRYAGICRKSGRMVGPPTHTHTHLLFSAVFHSTECSLPPGHVAPHPCPAPRLRPHLVSRTVATFRQTTGQLCLHQVHVVCWEKGKCSVMYVLSVCMSPTLLSPPISAGRGIQNVDVFCD